MDSSFWFGDYSTAYRYMRVSRATGSEIGELYGITPGSITRNDDTSIKESAECKCTGGFDIGADLVRVYMDATSSTGEAVSVPLGTFVPAVPSRTVDGPIETSAVKLYGRLQELEDDDFAVPLTVPGGSNAVDIAAGICRDAGLEVLYPKSGYVTTDARYYGVGATSDSQTVDSKLGAVNDLLSLAGYRSAHTDAMGRVTFDVYREPSVSPAAWTFREGRNARFESEVSEELDYTSTANHVVVRYASTEENKAFVGEAWDRDPESPLSTVSRGRTITKSYTYDELPPGKDDAARQGSSDAKAGELLAAEQAVIHRVTVNGTYAPVDIADTVAFSYPTGGIEGKFAVRTETLKLSGGCPMQIELKRNVRSW